MKKSSSPWTHKPWWCQPWSVMLTGTTLIVSSWVLTKAIWFTVVVSIPLLMWMGFFLLVWPQLMIRGGLLETSPQELNK